MQGNRDYLVFRSFAKSRATLQIFAAASTLYGARRDRARDSCVYAFLASNAAVRRRPVQLRAALLQIAAERQSNTKTSTVVVKSARAAPWKTWKEWGLLAVAAVARLLLAEAPVVPEVNPYRPCFFQTEFWMDWPLSFAMIGLEGRVIFNVVVLVDF
jgi:hypothetical protein